MPTYQDFIYGDKGFDSDLIRNENIVAIEIVTKFPNKISLVLSRFFFDKKGLCTKLETAGPWIGNPGGGPSSEFPMKNMTSLSYDDDGRLILEEFYDIETEKKLEETSFSYRDSLLEKSVRDRSFSTGDKLDVIEKRYKYDSEGDLQSLDVFLLKKARLQSSTQFEKIGGKLTGKISSTNMDDEDSGMNQLIEAISFFYNEFGQLKEAHTICNTGDESVDIFTYENPMSTNILEQHRTKNGRTEFRNRYIYLENGLISKSTKEFENQKFENEYRYIYGT